MEPYFYGTIVFLLTVIYLDQMYKMSREVDKKYAELVDAKVAHLETHTELLQKSREHLETLGRNVEYLKHTNRLIRLFDEILELNPDRKIMEKMGEYLEERRGGNQ